MRSESAAAGASAQNRSRRAGACPGLPAPACRQAGQVAQGRPEGGPTEFAVGIIRLYGRKNREEAGVLTNLFAVSDTQ
jgi:hypothetical protein